MKNQTLSKRYARALMELGKQDGQYLQYGQELTSLAGALCDAGIEAKAITSPAYPEGIRRKMLTAVLTKAQPSALVNNFVQLLMDKGRLGDLAAISEAYNTLADDEQGVVRAKITSAAPLAEADVTAICDSLFKFANRKVEVTVDHDASLIGGLIAQVGDLTIDGSVRTQLNKMSELLG